MDTRPGIIPETLIKTYSIIVTPVHVHLDYH